MTNFFIIGAIFFIIVAIFVLAASIITGLIMDRIEARRIRKEIGEDFEYVIMPKSEMEKYKEYRNKLTNLK